MQPANLNSRHKAAEDARPGPAQSGSETLPAIALDAGVAGSIAVLSADLAGNITSCNGAALRMFGGTPPEILGRTLAALMSGDGNAESHQLQKIMLAAVLEDGQYQSSRRCESKAEKRFTAEWSVTLLRDGTSAPAGMVALLSVAEEKSNPGPCSPYSARCGRGRGGTHRLA